MRAWVLTHPGGPEALKLEERPMPVPKPGWVRIRIRAFGLNRSEYFTRIGASPSVQLPRVLGIECVGTVCEDPEGRLPVGQKVAAMMGGMGRVFDGSYAAYTCVPRACIFPLDTELSWARLGALPEMLQTCHGSLALGLQIQTGQTLLIRGGTSSIGLATLALARELGVRVWTTTRRAERTPMLLEAGAEGVLVDEGVLEGALRERFPAGVDAVLELIGASTLKDSLKCVRAGGVVCMTGILGGQWVLPDFEPMVDIPSGVRLSSYSGGAQDIEAATLQRYVDAVEAGRLHIQTGPVFAFEDLVQAHHMMDAGRAGGKLVVVLP